MYESVKMIAAERGEETAGVGVAISVTFSLEHVYLHQVGRTTLYTQLLAKLYASLLLYLLYEKM